MKKTSKNPKETKQLANALFKKYPNHRVWLLYGEMGTGKTTFVKGLGVALGIEAKQIKSPTFTIVSEHENLIHYDLYRLEKQDEHTVALLNEHLQSEKRIVIEWPEILADSIDLPHLKIRFSHKGGNKRWIEVIPPFSAQQAFDPVA